MPLARATTAAWTALLLALLGVQGRELGLYAGVPGPTPASTYVPQRDESIVVFAAHPDDETLGAGGLIHRAVSAGAHVTVVIFTNGDGYLEGVDVGFHTLFSTPQKFIQYGALRQQEALAAAAQLGVAPSQVVFLGYPDRGLAVLWGPRWGCARPYVSPYTRKDRSPYSRTYNPEARYCGEDVLSDVTSVLHRVQPMVIVLHHPEDTHRDHWAAEAFVTAAVERLAAEGEEWARRVQVLHYLVHHGPYPTPRTYAPDLGFRLPQDLWVGPSRWIQVPLDPSDLDAKRRALLEYRTQLRLLRTFMLSFVRRDELFDLYPAVLPERLRDADAPPLGTPEAWDRLPTVLRLPLPGSFLQVAEPGATVESLAVAWTGSRLLLGVGLRRPALREVKYRFDVRLVYPGGRIACLEFHFRPPARLAAERQGPECLSLPPGAGARSVGRRIHLALPLDAEPVPTAAFVHLVTVSPLRTVVDRIPWTVVRLHEP